MDDFVVKAKRRKGGFSRVSFEDGEGGGASFAVFLAAFVVLAFSACAVFFLNLRGAEKVLVPDVLGKDLPQALVELQAKELNARVQLRYTDNTEDAGSVLEQSPKAGAIVKGDSRVALVVSRGAIVNQVGDYTGRKLDDVQASLQSMFAGYSRPLISLATPQYKENDAEYGTILEQNPAPGTGVSHQTTVVHLVVSSGPNADLAEVPNLVGSTISAILRQINKGQIVFDFASHTANVGERLGEAVWQQRAAGEQVRPFTRIAVDLAMPEGGSDGGGNVYGIFSHTLSVYPYPVLVTLVAEPPEGSSFVVAELNHPGGAITVPYVVPLGTTLILSANGRSQRTIIADGGRAE